MVFGICVYQVFMGDLFAYRKACKWRVECTYHLHSGSAINNGEFCILLVGNWS